VRRTLFGSFAILASCAAPAPIVVEPLIESASYWNEASNPSCDDAACFPKMFDAVRMCEARCLFTKSGRGNPEGFERAFAGKIRPPAGPRYFIVAYGPPASGKSSILRYLAEQDGRIGAITEQNTVSVNVDDIFQGGETGARYAEYRQRVLEKSAPANRKINAQRLYNSYRWIADQISDLILSRALNDGYNIIWETTGQSTWPRSEISRVGRYRYNTVVVYPLVRTGDLIARAAQREKETGQEPAPESVIRAAVGSAQANLVELLPTRECAAEAGPKAASAADRLYTDRTCTERAHRVILLDNTGARGAISVFFDSADKGKHCGKRRDLLGVLQERALADAVARADPCRGD
jgi:AAA domain-containing protein